MSSHVSLIIFFAAELSNYYLGSSIASTVWNGHVIHMLGMVVHTCAHRTWKGGSGRSEIQGHPLLYIELKCSLSYVKPLSTSKQNHNHVACLVSSRSPILFFCGGNVSHTVAPSSLSSWLLGIAQVDSSCCCLPPGFWRTEQWFAGLSALMGVVYAKLIKERGHLNALREERVHLSNKTTI